MGYALEDKTYYTVEKYLQYEEESEIRHEFYKNELFPVASTTRRHNEIVGNVYTLLRQSFRPKGCGIFMESVKVEVVKNEYYPYPDIVLTCDPTDNNNQLVKNPVLIVEVTSKSTAANDRSFKWAHYRKIPSLCYYLLVSQDEVMVEMFSRNGSSHLWTFQDFTSPDDVILLDTLSYQLPVKAIYELIRFEEE